MRHASERRRFRRCRRADCRAAVLPHTCLCLHASSSASSAVVPYLGCAIIYPNGNAQQRKGHFAHTHRQNRHTIHRHPLGLSRGGSLVLLQRDTRCDPMLYKHHSPCTMPSVTLWLSPFEISTRTGGQKFCVSAADRCTRM